MLFPYFFAFLFFGFFEDFVVCNCGTPCLEPSSNKGAFDPLFIICSNKRIFKHKIKEKDIKKRTNRDPEIEGIECEARQFVDNNGECQPRQDEGAISCLTFLTCGMPIICANI